MAEQEISDDRFKGEVMRLLNNLIEKVDGNTHEIINLKNEVGNLNDKVDTVIGTNNGNRFKSSGN